jgi:hypothetical protein
MEPGLLFENARDLFEAYPTLSDDMVGRPGGEPALTYFAQLLTGPVPEEAVTFGAYLLPRRRAVWWAHQCLVNITHLLNDQDLRMLQLAEAWVREPEEEQRNLAMMEGLAARYKTPGVWVALAAGWSGGSMAEPTQPRIPPPPFLTPRAVNAGILAAVARVDAKSRAQTLAAFVNMGIRSVSGRR